MSISEVLGSESGITLLGTVLGGLWTLFKSSELFERIRRRRFRRTLDALEGAVSETYQGYVKSIKASREDGRLTEAEKRQARRLAQERAGSIARKQGINLLREIGEDYLDLWTAKMVQKLKRG